LNNGELTKGAIKHIDNEGVGPAQMEYNTSIISISQLIQNKLVALIKEVV